MRRVKDGGMANGTFEGYCCQEINVKLSPNGDEKSFRKICCESFIPTVCVSRGSRNRKSIDIESTRKPEARCFGYEQFGDFLSKDIQAFDDFICIQFVVYMY